MADARVALGLCKVALGSVADSKNETGEKPRGVARVLHVLPVASSQYGKLYNNPIFFPGPCFGQRPTRTKFYKSIDANCLVGQVQACLRTVIASFLYLVAAVPLVA
jgi:hypothetical protein